MNPQPKSKRWQDACGPLQSYLDDPTVTEIMVNGPDKIFIEQKGLLKKTSAHFESASALLNLMETMAAAIDRELSPANPYIDGRLPDGSRINCVIPPVSIDGPALTIRKFSKDALNHQQLLTSGTWDERIAYFLSVCVQARLNIIVAGGTGSGKTTMLNVLSSFIPAHERLVVIEDTSELQLKSENIVRLEGQPPAPNSSGISIRNLVANALRMRPDRIVVGECRGPETIDMLTAMNTGHDGSMTTVHANSARDALRRIETMIMMSGNEIPLKALRQLISSSLHLIVQTQRCTDGIRRVTEVLEVGGMEGEVILSQEVCTWSETSGFRFSGFVPQFVHLFRERNLKFPPDFFTDSYKIRLKGS